MYCFSSNFFRVIFFLYVVFYLQLNYKKCFIWNIFMLHVCLPELCTSQRKPPHPRTYTVFYHIMRQCVLQGTWQIKFKPFTLTCVFDLFSTRAGDMSGVISFNFVRRKSWPGNVWHFTTLAVSAYQMLRYVLAGDAGVYIDWCITFE